MWTSVITERRRSLLDPAIFSDEIAETDLLQGLDDSLISVDRLATSYSIIDEIHDVATYLVKFILRHADLAYFEDIDEFTTNVLESGLMRGFRRLPTLLAEIVDSFLLYTLKITYGLRGHIQV